MVQSISKVPNETNEADVWLDMARAQINETLRSLIPAAHIWPQDLHAAQHHALMAPGKRFRPLLCLAISQGLGFTDKQTVLRIGAVAEMIHTASLILDDLPCMDDADIRRGLPTIHKVYSESTAILAATNLLNRAFGITARTHSLTPKQCVAISDSLAASVGSDGLIAGQVADLSNSDMSISTVKVERVNALKTGALFDFTVNAAAIMGNANPTQHKALMQFSKQIGLAFQLLDDLKDEVLSEQQSQKTTGRDIGKATLLALEGNKKAIMRLKDYMAVAKSSLHEANLLNESLIAHVIEQQFKLSV